jgi:hypothetical protein
MANIPSSLAAYMHWAPRVGCYSFDWHLVPKAAEGQPTQRAGV